MKKLLLTARYLGLMFSGLRAQDPVPLGSGSFAEPPPESVLDLAECPTQPAKYFRNIYHFILPNKEGQLLPTNY